MTSKNNKVGRKYSDVVEWGVRAIWTLGTGHFPYYYICKTEVYFKRLSLIVRVNVVLNRTVVVDSDWRFDNLCGSHLQSQSELYYVSWYYYTLVIDLIGQLRRDVIGRLSVKPRCYGLWRLKVYYNELCLLRRMTTAVEAERANS